MNDQGDDTIKVNEPEVEQDIVAEPPQIDNNSSLAPDVAQASGMNLGSIGSLRDTHIGHLTQHITHVTQHITHIEINMPERTSLPEDFQPERLLSPPLSRRNLFDIIYYILSSEESPHDE